MPDRPPSLLRRFRGAAAATADRLWRWGLVLAEFTLVQLMVQAIGMVAGLIVVRSLAKHDYAYYTIATTTLAALFSLSNSGVTFAASAIGGRVWQDPRRLGQMVVTAFRASRWTTALAIVPLLGMLGWLLRQNGAPPLVLAPLVVLVAGGAMAQLRTAILVTVPRLQREFRLLQKVDLGATSARLVLLAAAAVIYIDATVALLFTVLVGVGQWRFMRRWVGRTVPLTEAPDPAMAGEIRHVIRRQWLNDAYYAFYGQISVLLLSIFGTPDSVADLGALGRLGTVFVALGATMQAVVLPAYARCQDPRRLLQLYAQIVGAIVAIALVPVLAVLVAPAPLLWLLGAKYAHLSHELLLMAFAAGMSVISGALGQLHLVRGWIVPGWITVPIAAASQILLIVAIGPTTLDRVLWMSILSYVPFALLSAVATAWFWKRRLGTA